MDDVFLLYNLQINYFFLYPIDNNKEKELKIWVRTKILLIFKFFNCFEYNNKLCYFFFFGIKLRTYLEISTSKHTPRTMRLTFRTF